MSKNPRDDGDARAELEQSAAAAPAAGDELNSAGRHGFCVQCGYSLKQKTPEGDNRLRKVCMSCDFIVYENPKNVVGCLLEWQDSVLLCKRAIEPRRGYWTLPAGFMENRESTLEGAAREAYEEATAECDNLRLFSVYNLPHISQVYLMYFGTLKNGFARANEETLDVGLFKQSDIPWEELAFPVVTEALSRYFEMREQGNFQVYSADIFSRPGAPLKIVRHT